MEPKRLYLSPSTQDANDYATGGMNEEAMMRRVAFPAADLLRAAGHIVRVGGTVSARANMLDSNAWGADYHIAFHTNTGGGHGTEVLAYKAGTEGDRLAHALQARIAPVSNEPDRTVKYHPEFVELNATQCPAAIIEFLFHDCRAESDEMQRDYLQFARAAALGICDIAGGSLPGSKPAEKRSTKVWAFSTADDGKTEGDIAFQHAALELCKANGIHVYEATEAEKLPAWSHEWYPRPETK